MQGPGIFAGEWFIPNPDRGQILGRPHDRLIVGGAYRIELSGKVASQIQVRDRTGNLSSLELEGYAEPLGSCELRIIFTGGVTEVFRIVDKTTLRRASSGIGTVESSIDLILQRRFVPAEAQTDHPMLVFIHIPRTGGTSINSIIESNFEYAVSIPEREAVSRFLRYPRNERSRYAAAYGHMTFGIHHHVDVPCRYAVFLRDPIDRAISSYYHILTHPESTEHARVRKMTFMEYALSEHWGANDNLQTRCMASDDWNHFLEPPEERPCDNDMLAQAQANLDLCDFIGVFEEFDESVRRFCDLFDIRYESIPKLNASKDRISVQDLNSQDQEEIREKLKYDYQLYEYARAGAH